VAEPAQHPPQPRGIRAAVAVERDHLRLGRDAERPRDAGEGGAIGQGMAAVLPGLRRAQVAVEMDIERARHVAGGERGLAGGDVAEVEARVEDDRRDRARLQGAQRVDADQGGEGGGGRHTVLGESSISARRGLRLRSSVADRPAPAIRSMPAIAIAVTLSPNSSTP
jgi:hypothetical protein